MLPAVLSHAWASWKSAPGIALLAIVAFAVGIGSATAIFTVINGVMLRPLPYPEGERFVSLYGARVTEPGQYSSSTFPDLITYQQRTTSFDVFGWFRLGNFNLTSASDPQYVPGVAVTPSLAQNLGVNPFLGQWFTDDSGVVISNTLWTRLGARTDIIGTGITLDDRRLTVTGVMPAGFSLPVTGTVPTGEEAEVWIALDPLGAGQNPNDGIYFVYARRKPGVSLAQAQADAKRVAAEIAESDPASHPSYTAEVVELREPTFRDLRSTLFLLLGAAGLLLLISCANVATLLLARSVARARETAIRVALGASQRHLALRYFVEGSLVSLLGAAAGVGLSVVLVRLIVIVGSEYVPYADEIAIDWKVLAFGVAMAFVAGALAGLAPLWQAWRTAPNAVLTDGVRASAAAPVRKLSQALVVAEVALAFTLLTVSAILVVHLRDLGRVSTGFNPDDLLTFQLTLPERVMTSPVRVPSQTRLIDALQEAPGITSAAFANQLPLDPGCLGGTIHAEGRPPGQEARRVCFVFTTPEYLRTMGIPLRAGRFLTETDTSDEFLFAVVNETAVRTYWPDRDPVGAYGRLNRPDGNRFQVIGVVGDVRNDGLKDDPDPDLYLLATIIPVNPMNVVVRSPLPAAQLISEVRRAIQRPDPTLAIHDVRTMNDIVRDSLQLERVTSFVMTFFALAALLMATLGIYGVVSYSVRQRTVEMGTRMALGAVSRDLLTLVLGNGLKLSAAGIGVGAVAVVAGVWLLVRFLEIRGIGWLPFASSTAVVMGIAAAAASVPAWRATLLSPMVAIRNEPATVWLSARERFRRAVREVRQAVSAADEASAVPALNLLTAFVGAARTAGSYTEALQSVLTTVCTELGIESAILLERGVGPEPRYRCRVAVGAFGAADLAVPADGFLVNRLEAYPLPLPFARHELQALSEWAAANRPARLDEIQRLAGADVRLAVPLRTRNEIMGMLLLGAPAGRDQYSSVEKQVLRACADQFALMIENARLTDRVVEQEALRRDLALAADVQKRLFPDAPPQAVIAEFAAVSLPARRIGGDYYDFIQVREDQIGIALADVSGKGVAAALIMSIVQASLRIISSEGDLSLARLVARMNQFLYRSTPASKYATFFYAQLDGDRRLRYVNAGHNAPYLVRAGRCSLADGVPAPAGIEELSTGGTVIGMFPETDYDEATLDLHAGDVLLAFTDGVPEAQNPDNVEFGEERLKQLLCETVHMPADAIRAQISARLKEWISDAEQYDDLTFIVMKMR